MKFTTGEIISAGTGRLCCDMGAVYRIMNYLTGDNLFTHQLPRAFRVCQPHLLEQHPWLKGLDETKCSPQTWRAWLDEAIARFGAEHEVQPIPSDAWKSQDPISELVGMVGADRVIVAGGN